MIGDGEPRALLIQNELLRPRELRKRRRRVPEIHTGEQPLSPRRAHFPNRFAPSFLQRLERACLREDLELIAPERRARREVLDARERPRLARLLDALPALFPQPAHLSQAYANRPLLGTALDGAI